MTHRVYAFIIDRPKSILFFLLLLTVFFASHARHIRLDSSVETLLPRNDPEKAYYDEIRRQFGSDEIGVIGVIADDIYTPEILRKIKRLTETIRQIPEVKNVISLTNAPDIITLEFDQRSSQSGQQSGMLGGCLTHPMQPSLWPASQYTWRRVRSTACFRRCRQAPRTVLASCCSLGLPVTGQVPRFL